MILRRKKKAKAEPASAKTKPSEKAVKTKVEKPPRAPPVDEIKVAKEKAPPEEVKTPPKKITEAPEKKEAPTEEIKKISPEAEKAPEKKVVPSETKKEEPPKEAPVVPVWEPKEAPPGLFDGEDELLAELVQKLSAKPSAAPIPAIAPAMGPAENHGGEVSAEAVSSAPQPEAAPQLTSAESIKDYLAETDTAITELAEKVATAEKTKAPQEFYDYCTFEVPAGYQELERYWITKPFCWTTILYSPDRNERIYHLVEPCLTPGEKTALELLHEHLLDRLAYDERIKDRDRILTTKVNELLREYGISIGVKSIRKLLYYLKRNYIGYGRIDPLLHDPNIEDISCDGLNVPIFIYSRRYQSLRTNLIFTEVNELDLFVIRLVERAGKQISLGRPTIDASMPEGFRLQATLGTEVTTRGSSFSIRKYSEEPFTPVDLLSYGTFSVEMLAYLWLATENKKNIVIVGGTASGKTSTLNALSLFIWPDAKIVSIEDTRELALYQDNWIPSVTRPAPGERGIEMYDLLRQALRQRPEVIIMGEVRGKEALTMFQAMTSVSGETPILIQASEPKLVPIGEFIDGFYETNEEGPKPINGVSVLTVKGGRATFEPVKYVLRHKAGKIYKIHYQGGAVDSTGSHSVFTVDDFGNIVCKLVDELKPGDNLITFKNSSSGGIRSRIKTVQGKRRTKKIPPELDVDEDLAFALGVYLADGNVNKKRTEICFSLGKKEKGEFLGKVIKFFSRFGINHGIVDRDSYVLVKFFSASLARTFEELCGRILSEKHVPRFLWRSDPSLIKAFLEGYKADARRTARQLNYTTKNHRLGNEIAWLARLGGLSSFTSDADHPYKTIYVWQSKRAQSDMIPLQPIIKLKELLDPASCPYELTYLFRRDQVCVNKKTAAKVLEWIIRKARKSADARARHIIDNVQKLIVSDLGVTKVLDIKAERCDKYVYDVSVEGSEAFFGGQTPVLLHNTGHTCYSTMHAGSIQEMVHRLEGEPINVPHHMLSSLDIVCLQLLSYFRDQRVRRNQTIIEVVGIDPATGSLRTNRIFERNPLTDEFERVGESQVLREIAKERGWSALDLERELRQRREVLQYLVKTNIRRLNEVAAVTRQYFFEPEKVIEQLTAGKLKM